MEDKMRHFLLLSLTLLLILLFFSFPVQNTMAATTGKIAGMVFDQETNEPLPGVNIQILGTTLGAASDIRGNYYIINVPPGEYQVRSSMMGYANIVVSEVRVVINQTTSLDFTLQREVIAGEEVTIVAEKPVVELDLTASKARMSGEEFSRSWVATVEDAVTLQSGVNVHGGVRGGFGLDVSYLIDGQEIRDIGSNSTFMAINTSTIQEMEVLTGGWNAEYPQANSGIVNIVTKSSRDQMHGSVRYRYRPPGIYHWGPHIYSKDNWEWTNMDLQFWTEHDGGREPFQSMTPEQRLQAWRDGLEYAANSTLADYDKRADWETEVTLNGPITEKLGFLLSGRWHEQAGEFPSALKYHPVWNLQLKLDYHLTQQTSLMLTGMHWGTDNAGKSETPYMSTEDAGFGAGNPGGYFYSAYNVGKYWPWGGFAFGGGSSLGRLKPPEYIRQYSFQLKGTHIFNPKTYLEVKLQHYQMKRRADFFGVDQGYYNFDDDTAPFEFYNTHYMNNGLFRNFGEGSDAFWDRIRARDNSVKADFVSQVNPHHQIKAGAKFSYQYYYKVFALGWSSTAFTTDYLDPDFNPWETSAYVQDKIEYGGMIVNAGLRLDMYNANKKVNYTIFDPMAISTMTLGHTREVGFIEFDPEGRFAKSTPTQVALSPRIGISHPISENTVLHFMYGHFNQRPGWMKIGSNGDVQDGPRQETTQPPQNQFPLDSTDVKYNSNNIIFGNPNLDFERMIQYEVGIEQNIANLLRFDFTMYYKDGKNLTSLGYSAGRPDTDFGFTTGIRTTLYPDPDDPTWGKTGKVIVPINGGFMDVRGLEAMLETQFLRHAQFKLMYNMSYMSTDRYGASTLYQMFPGGVQLGTDRFFGGRNNDKGGGGNPNERWNPRHTFKLIANFDSPEEFGPRLGSCYPLGNWYLNLYSEYSSGRKFTYHSPGDLSTEPNNETWKPRYLTNLRISKVVEFIQGLRTEVSINVNNLFNNKQLVLPSGQNLVDYMEEGKLWVHPVTKEDLEWEWYELTLLPRQIFFGISLEF